MKRRASSAGDAVFFNLVDERLGLPLVVERDGLPDRESRSGLFLFWVDEVEELASKQKQTTTITTTTTNNQQNKKKEKEKTPTPKLSILPEQLKFNVLLAAAFTIPSY